MIVSLRTQRRALAVPRRAGQICGLLRWMRICKTIGASAGASPRPTLGAALYDRCCAKRSFPILLRQPGWHFTIGIRDSRGCSLHNTKSVGGHIRPNRKFARTSFSKSFFMVFTCLIRTGLVQTASSGPGNLRSALGGNGELIGLERMTRHAHATAAHVHSGHHVLGSEGFHEPRSPFLSFPTRLI